MIASHSFKKTVTLREFAESDDCPWSLERLRDIANLALKGDPKYKHLPFIRPQKGSKIRVNPLLMRRVLYRGASEGYRRLAA